MRLDFKNVQRRVYDALNVLSALDVINKDRNRITFKGYSQLLKQSSQYQSQGISYPSDATRPEGHLINPQDMMDAIKREEVRLLLYPTLSGVEGTARGEE